MELKLQGGSVLGWKKGVELHVETYVKAYSLCLWVTR